MLKSLWISSRKEMVNSFHARGRNVDERKTVVKGQIEKYFSERIHRTVKIIRKDSEVKVEILSLKI